MQRCPKRDHTCGSSLPEKADGITLPYLTGGWKTKAWDVVEKEPHPIEYDPQRQGGERLRYEVDAAAREHLETEVFGKRLLITDRQDWSDEEIILAYRGQSHAERTFQPLKDEDHCAVRPQFHWTDQKIRVHTFIGLLGLLLGRVVEYEARQLSYTQGLSGLLDLLGGIRLAMILRAPTIPQESPSCQWQLEQSDPQAWRLFRHLVPAKPPFVYT